MATYQSRRRLLRRRTLHHLRFLKQRVLLVRWVHPRCVRKPLQGLPYRNLTAGLDGPGRKGKRSRLPKRRLPLAVPKSHGLKRRHQAGRGHRQDSFNQHNLWRFHPILLEQRILFLQYSVPLFPKENVLRWISTRRIPKTSGMTGQPLRRRTPHVRTLMEFFNVFYLFLFILQWRPG